MGLVVIQCLTRTRVNIVFLLSNDCYSIMQGSRSIVAMNLLIITAAVPCLDRDSNLGPNVYYKAIENCYVVL